MNNSTPEPLNILEFPDFCEELQKLPKNNFEIGYHGFFHGIPGVSNNDEFKDLNTHQAEQKFKLMFKTVKSAGLESVFKPIFRPPAWKMSPEAIKAADQAGIEILALSPKEIHKKIYNHLDEKYKKVVYYNCNPPFDELKLYNKTEIVYHACEWDRNYLGELHTEELQNFLFNDIENISFCFMKDL
jgi:predicted deacetylase